MKTSPELGSGTAYWALAVATTTKTRAAAEMKPMLNLQIGGPVLVAYIWSHTWRVGIRRYIFCHSGWTWGETRASLLQAIERSFLSTHHSYQFALSISVRKHVAERLMSFQSGPTKKEILAREIYFCNLGESVFTWWCLYRRLQFEQKIYSTRFLWADPIDCIYQGGGGGIELLISQLISRFFSVSDDRFKTKIIKFDLCLQRNYSFTLCLPIILRRIFPYLRICVVTQDYQYFFFNLLLALMMTLNTKTSAGLINTDLCLKVEL